MCKQLQHEGEVPHIPPGLTVQQKGFPLSGFKQYELAVIFKKVMTAALLS